MTQVKPGRPPRALETQQPDVTFVFSPEADTQNAVHARLRATSPVALQQGDGRGNPSAWLITRHADIVAAASAPEQFGQSLRFPEARRPPLEANPPEHQLWRQLLQPFFYPNAMAAIEPFSRGLARSLLAPLLADGGGDIAHAVARPLPAQVLLRWLGQPPEDWLKIKQACEDAYLQRSTDPEDHARFRAADAYLWDYARSAVATRQASPAPPPHDPVSALLAAMATEPAITLPLVEGVVRLMLAAGHDSTTSALGMCLHFVATDAPLQDTLRTDPAKIPVAIEEMLRLRPPVLQMPRTVMENTSFGGRDMAEQDAMMLVFASGNLDEEVFENPTEFDLDRRPNRHLTFGTGVHRCIGNMLARQEMRVVLEELLAATSAISLAAPAHHEFWHPHGVTSLPVVLEPASAPPRS